MRNRRLTPGVKGKFVLATALIILALGATTTVFIHAVLTKTLTGELKERGTVITRNLAANSLEAVLTEDVVHLRRLISNAKKVEKDIAYIYIVNSEGQIMAHSFEGGFPVALMKYIGHGGDILLDTDEGFIHDISAPILGGKAGYVHVGISESSIRARIYEVTRTMALLTIMAGATGMLLAYLTGDLITRPLYALKRGVEEIGRGRLHSKIDVKSRDEIGVLAQAFNKMTKDLEHSMNEIRDYSTRLEQKVEEKTRELLLLQNINNMLNTGASLEDILDALTRGIASVFDYDSCAVHLLNEEKNALICKSYYMDSELVKKAEKLTGMSPLNYVTHLHTDNPLKRVIETKEPFITNDIVGLIKSHTTNPRLRALAEPVGNLLKTRWGIGAPLLAGDKVVGVIGVGSRTRLTEDDADRLASFAAQVGLAVEKARLERELKAYSEHLEQKIEEKTRQLIQSEKLASLGQLAAGVAHEINNPLTNILLDAEALQRRCGSEEEKRRAEEIIEQVEVVKRIVHNLLEFSRQVEPEIREVDVEELIDKTLSMLSHQLRDIRIEKNLITGLKIKGDLNQLEHVLLNIFLNAIQAMPGGGKLRIDVKSPDGSVEIHITDTGIGIPQEDIGKIFDPFFTTKKIGEGTGLGLSIAMGIVQRHKGEIRVKSKVGKGSTFIVKLPAGDDAGPDTDR
jgi:signal transduction histidine kinase